MKLRTSGRWYRCTNKIIISTPNCSLDRITSRFFFNRFNFVFPPPPLLRVTKKPDNYGKKNILPSNPARYPRSPRNSSREDAAVFSPPTYGSPRPPPLLPRSSADRACGESPDAAAAAVLRILADDPPAAATADPHGRRRSCLWGVDGCRRHRGSPRTTQPPPRYCGSSRTTDPRIAAATLRITRTQPSCHRGGGRRTSPPSPRSLHITSDHGGHITSDRRNYIALWRVILGITMFVGLSKGNRECGGACVRRVADVHGCMESQHPRLQESLCSIEDTITGMKALLTLRN